MLKSGRCLLAVDRAGEAGWRRPPATCLATPESSNIRSRSDLMPAAFYASPARACKVARPFFALRGPRTPAGVAQHTRRRLRRNARAALRAQSQAACRHLPELNSNCNHATSASDIRNVPAKPCATFASSKGYSAAKGPSRPELPNHLVSSYTDPSASSHSPTSWQASWNHVVSGPMLAAVLCRLQSGAIG